ncbi:hypothetical protein [Micromonospora sp. WMMD812]|uniref:hypothetical protein n=1 Tax=Micromonospora sp. WMMD812 TaxID=3015152 RepID=UPI00248D0008|nr:hypothetical protein [Micromonospora sp. WMMD812]WBB69261.1 hypothetical protein O7603_07890 [Micromonospora sp. WMMD812]
MLRVNRLHGQQGEWTAATAFADAFQGGCWRERTSVYRISRWETAAVRVPYLAVRRYEQLLDLPGGSLVALLDTIYRYFAPDVSASPLLARGADARSTEKPAQIDQLLELVLSDGIVTGSEWDELTAHLAATPRQIITPRSAWDKMAQRLLSEMIIADGVAWMQRHEAFNRLLAHPVGQQAAIATCADLAADRTGQVFVETVSILDGSPHPDASRHLLAQLISPTNDRAQYGALLGCIRKLRYGHFTRGQLQRLLPIVHDMVLDPATYARAQPLAAELLRRLPADVSASAKAQLSRAITSDPAMQQALDARHPVREEAAAVRVARITGAALAQTSVEAPHFHDQLLPALLEEMLFSPVFDVRLYAAMLLSGTPYRQPLATTLASELAVSAASGPVEEALTIIEALRIIGTSEQRPMIERLTTATGLPSTIALAATQAIGHIGGRSSDHYWRQAIAHHARRWRQSRTTTHATALVGLVYALGIARNERMLQLVRGDATVPAEPRAAASWWLNLPRRILDSALW